MGSFLIFESTKSPEIQGKREKDARVLYFAHLHDNTRVGSDTLFDVLVAK